MKIYRHRKRQDGSFVLTVHVEPDKVLDADDPRVLDGSNDLGEGDPDPDFVREFEYAPKPPGLREWEGDPDADPPVEPGPLVTDAKWAEMQRREAKLLIEGETKPRRRRTEGTKVAGEGDDL